MSQNTKVILKRLVLLACFSLLFVTGCGRDEASTQDQAVADTTVQPTPTSTAPVSPSGPAVSSSARVGRPSPATPQADPTSPTESVDQRLQRLKRKDAAIVAELDKAYARFWEVYEEAAAKGETLSLSEVLAEQALQDITERINQLKETGRGVHGRYEHSVAYTRVTPSSADVIDRIVDRSVYIDLKTGKRLQRTQPSSQYYLTSKMERIDGVWKVVSLKYKSEPR